MRLSGGKRTSCISRLASDSYKLHGFFEWDQAGRAERANISAKNEWCLNALKWRRLRNKLHFSSGKWFVKLRGVLSEIGLRGEKRGGTQELKVNGVGIL